MGDLRWSAVVWLVQSRSGGFARLEICSGSLNDLNHLESFQSNAFGFLPASWVDIVSFRVVSPWPDCSVSKLCWTACDQFSVWLVRALHVTLICVNVCDP